MMDTSTKVIRILAYFQYVTQVALPIEQGDQNPGAGVRGDL